MPDTGSNIIIDISGNTANMATDFAAAGVGITNAHVPIQKLAFGDDTVTKRVSSSEPLPITIQSNQERVGVSGDVGITGFVQVGNYGEIPVQGSTFALIRNFVKVAGSTSGDPVGVSLEDSQLEFRVTLQSTKQVVCQLRGSVELTVLLVIWLQFV